MGELEVLLISQEFFYLICIYNIVLKQVVKYFYK